MADFPDERLQPEPLPVWLEPMRATLTATAFSHPDWVFERKLDGVRALAFRRAGEVRLRSRTNKDIVGTYPEVAEAVGELEVPDIVLDGEIVAFDGPATSFALLQRRMGLRDPIRARRTGVAVYYYVFDLLHLDGFSTRALPLRERKRVLAATVDLDDPLRLAPHVEEAGEQLFETACREGWEGILAKRASSTYQLRRSHDWLKVKCLREQEFVVGGYTEPTGRRTGFGALLVGHYEGDELRFAGKVGTGFDDRTLRELGAGLRSLEQPTSPFADAVREKTAHWVSPYLVAQVAFSDWTDDGRLRHPRYLGLRADKEPRDVVRERPAP